MNTQTSTSGLLAVVLALSHGVCSSQSPAGGGIRIPAVAQTLPLERVWVADGTTVYQMDVRLDASQFSEGITNADWTFGVPPYLTFVNAAFPTMDFFFEGMEIVGLSNPVFQSQTDVDGNIISITGVINTESAGHPGILNGDGILASYWFTVKTDAPVGKSQFTLNNVAIGYHNPNFPPDINCPGGGVGAICDAWPDTIESIPFTIVALSPADLTGPGNVPDGCVDAFDLGAMLGAWCSGVSDPNPPSPPCENCTPANLAVADISGAAMVPDGCVDAFDLANLLAEWCSVAGGNPCGTCF